MSTKQNEACCDHNSLDTDALDSSCPACLHYLLLSASALAVLRVIVCCKTTTSNLNGVQLPLAICIPRCWPRSPFADQQHIFCYIHAAYIADISVIHSTPHLNLHVRSSGKHMHMVADVLCFHGELLMIWLSDKAHEFHGSNNLL